MLITAHGISDRERDRLEADGRRVSSTRRVRWSCGCIWRHRRLQAEGYHVLVIGRKGHVEVEGIIGDLDDYHVIESAEDVACYPHRRLGIVCQTTMTEERVGRTRSAIAERNPDSDVRFVNTVCLPTKEHHTTSIGCLNASRRSWWSAAATRTTARAVGRLSRAGQAGGARPVGRGAGPRLVQGLCHGRPDGGDLDAGGDHRGGPSDPGLDRFACGRIPAGSRLAGRWSLHYSPVSKRRHVHE